MDLLYPNSPFLPEISIEDIKKVEEENKHSLLRILALHCGNIGEKQNKIIEVEKTWILNNFNCQESDLLLFNMGFGTLIIVILSGIQLSYTHVEKVVKVLTAPTTLPLHKEHNSYLVNILHDAYYILKDKPDEKIPQTIDNITDLLLNKNLYTENQFYKSGIKSCQKTLISLYHSISLP